jgi:Flp pilus assembly protein TadD
MRKYFPYVLAGLFLVTGVWLAFPAGALAQPTAGSLMPEDVYTPLAKGYDLLRQGNYPAARFEFQDAVKLDPDNSFALNNLAVLDERDGKLKDAMSFLQQATLHAAQYKDKVQQTCFVGGLCTAVKPLRQTGVESSIAPIVQENIKRLQEKMAQAPAAPQPSAPPKMK